ncbi:hypothetical protein [Evansella cellulosilytica]|uniref:Uncharacterized protein n=1 Tax=Evansella cellulosilytica (strain ATCC 21833 / DSM 2522 / FERM P-1141 / JCM 9156 / N-4) TaxID=649639 RepID=E6TTK6_EVAC2|nr:hypothetical protein [Evansella cellulosilytica]ADU29642.1 hypothetical protein Bcell_1377 [Evansella cellulosilytica DSM 2522]
MKKFLIILIIIIGVGYGGYRLLLSYTSEELVSQIANEMLTDEVVEEWLSDPSVRQLLEEYKLPASELPEASEVNNLPFTTKEEATKAIVSKFSVEEITEITMQAARGMSADEQAEIERKVLERMSEEELEALMIIGLDQIANDMLTN